MSRVIAIANQKGGVGKTTTAINLGASLAAAEQRTLVVDIDPQANATSGLGIRPGEDLPTVYDVLVDRRPADQAVVREVGGLPFLDLLPSSRDLVGAEIELVEAPERERILRRALEPVRDRYDFILVDCPPSLGLLTLNTLAAADSVLIPIQCEFYALEGLSQLLSTVRLVQKGLNPALEIEGVLLTMYDRRLNLSRQVADEAREYFGDKVYRSTIPRNVRLAEAPSFGQPIIQYDVLSAGAQCYLTLARELMARKPETAPTGGRRMTPPKKDRLGRGLGALLGDYLAPEEAPPPSDVRTALVAHIVPNPLQPRKEFSEAELEELVGSIRQNGLLQPLVVRPSGPDRFELVAGERRFRSVQRLGWTDVPVVVREVDDEALLVLALVENLQREELNPLEEAEGYRTLGERFGLTQEEISRAVGKDRSTVANLLRLLRLPPSIRRLLENGELTMGHARALLSVEDPVRAADLARRAASEGWSVREVERQSRPAGGGKKAGKAKGPGDPVVRALEEALRERLSTRVQIRSDKKGTGVIEVPFHGTEDFERVFALLAGREASEIVG